MTAEAIHTGTKNAGTMTARVIELIAKFPEYSKTLLLAVAHEENNQGPEYEGWQWHEVETHPTKLIRLVTEGITTVTTRGRHASRYVLRDRESVKKALT